MSEEAEDDVPPPKGHPEEPTFGASLGGIFGASVWIAAIFVIAGALVYALIHWMS